MPSRNGKDHEGRSLSIERRELVDLHRLKYESERTCAAFLVTEAVRGIALEGRALGVAWAPERDDPAHALLLGMPGRANPSDDERRIAERYADLLGQAARSYSFAER